MKTKRQSILIGLATLALLSTLISQPSTSFAQGTAFTYQGRLTDNGAPATGQYDILFSLYDASSGGSQVNGTLMGTAVPVTNGLFTISLDFGGGIFTGAARWLKLDVRTNGGGAYIPLSPRQAVTATPYAILAGQISGNVPAGQVSGTLALAQLPGAVVTNNQSGVNLTGAFTGNGAGVSNVNALTLGGLGATNFWKTGGNAGTTAGTHFLGTTDNQPVEIKVNGLRALRLEPNTNGAPNVIGGSAGNFVAAGVVGAVIGGGGATNYFGFSRSNSVSADFGTIGGGYQNTIQDGPYSTIGGGGENTIEYVPGGTIGGGGLNTIQSYARYATIGGGAVNKIGDEAENATIAGGGFNTMQAYTGYSTIGGGGDNTIQSYSYAATIGGGDQNSIGTNCYGGVIGGGVVNRMLGDSPAATIAGGEQNSIGTNSSHSTVGGGNSNNITANAEFAAIPGGQLNAATNNAFAAGTRAKAIHTGAFVWGDSFDGNVSSSTNNEFTARASGGVRFFSNTNLTAGVSLAPGGTAWAVISDRNAKKDFAPVDSRAVLEKLAALPITQWHYRWEESTVTPHIGPMAQDFKAAFYPGSDDKSITTQEADGVALAAIQGLNEKVEVRSQKSEVRSRMLEEKLQQKETEITELKARLERLERLMSGKNGGGK